MNNKILLKKSSVLGKIPQTLDLSYGELALNYSDGKLYYKRSDDQVKVLNSSEISIITGGNTVTNTVTDVTVVRFDEDSKFVVSEISTGTVKIQSLGFVGMESNGTGTVTLETGFDLIPESDQQSLGSIDKPFKDIYVSTGSIYIGGAVIQANDKGEVEIKTLVSTNTGTAYSDWNSLRAKNLIIGTQNIPAYAMAENLTGILFPDGKFQPTAAPRMYTNSDAANGFTINDLYPGDYYYDDVTESIYITVDTGLGYYDLLDLTVRA
jgi:hypothetical protein